MSTDNTATTSTPTDSAEMTDEQIVERARAKRGGRLLPVHQLMAEVDPQILRKYDDLASDLLFAEQPRALDLKTRYLVLCGITTAVKGDPDGIVWSAQRAMKEGASRREVLEAILLSALPGGVPTVEEATHVFGRIFGDES
ncbi:carboxymuconolactone decarboxylase family protein [Actinokineospora spheciospongiae]|uniref:carboxymuconolactone decarboxylase family protein n=1 Tax=Actinokineospora spheciospongiae TaxID=909613 RepID=UPI000D715A5F|nr:carboxymuconolactone decarboxylase family protein [Actinokineospora spheciospongiae]PWW67180.1 alkylhydroperoxidase/carboxymuconolactone decarboxylase family protein YurZ [Actinokineospora spheciospongiae]